MKFFQKAFRPLPSPCQLCPSISTEEHASSMPLHVVVSQSSGRLEDETQGRETWKDREGEQEREKVCERERETERETGRERERERGRER